MQVFFSPLIPVIFVYIFFITNACHLVCGKHYWLFSFVYCLKQKAIPTKKKKKGKYLKYFKMLIFQNIRKSTLTFFARVSSLKS